MHFIRHIFGGVFFWSVIRAFRSSILSTVLLTLLASTGGWKYFTSTVTAHELTRAASFTRTIDAENLPVVIEIDDTGYEQFFSAKSPVSRERMLALLTMINAHTAAATRVTIDLDLSPVPGQDDAQAALQQFLFMNPKKWILPSVRGGNPEVAASLRKWRTMMCKHGVDFGLPYIPNDFGYPKITHQYEGSLADVSTRHGSCADPDAPLVQKRLPLQPVYLKSGLVIPFSGDLDTLAGILDLIKPHSIVLGGTWGQSDLFATPFGERFGVQIHAAALAGSLAGETIAPAWIGLLISWLFISLVTTCMYHTSRFINRQTANIGDNMVGHVFFAERLKPLLLMILAFVMLYLLMELLSLLHAATGFWISTSNIWGTVVVCLLVPWNLGRAEPSKYRNASKALKDEVIDPIRNDLISLRQSTDIIRGRAVRWVYKYGELPMSRGRALFEGACATVSLLFETIFPLVSLVFLINYKL